MRVLQKRRTVTAQCVRATCHGKALAYQYPPQCPTIPILSHAFVFQVFHVVLVFVARQPLWLVSAGKPFLIAGPVARGSGENIGIRIAEHVVLLTQTSLRCRMILPADQTPCLVRVQRLALRRRVGGRLRRVWGAWVMPPRYLGRSVRIHSPRRLPSRVFTKAPSAFRSS